MTLEAVIQIDAARLLPHLVLQLRAAGFSVRPISLHETGVVSRPAADADEALCELRFFVRAWARAHGDVAVSVRPAV